MEHRLHVYRDVVALVGGLQAYVAIQRAVALAADAVYFHEVRESRPLELSDIAPTLDAAEIRGIRNLRQGAQRGYRQVQLAVSAFHAHGVTGEIHPGLKPQVSVDPRLPAGAWRGLGDRKAGRRLETCPELFIEEKYLPVQQRGAALHRAVPDPQEKAGCQRRQGQARAQTAQQTRAELSRFCSCCVHFWTTS